MKNQPPPMRQKIFNVIKILAVLWLVSIAVAALFSFSGLSATHAAGNVALIPIYGEISTLPSGGFLSSGGTASEDIIASLEKAEENPGIKAIILDINSPGGSGVAADEISQKIKSINKTKVAVIRDVGASAAYWIASSCDYIYANRLSLTGSIGVIGSYLDFSGLMKDYNVTYERYVSGDLKDMGSPYKAPSDSERKVMQAIIDRMKEFFVDEVAANRHLSRDKVEKLATGQIFLGIDAKENGLVDYLGTKKDAAFFIEKKLNITADIVDYKPKKTLADFFSQFASQFVPKIGNYLNPLPYKFS